MTIVVKGGSVLTAHGLVDCDLVVEDGVVASMGAGAAARESTVIDAVGCLVGPGFVDLHTHLRDPGQTWKEDLASGSSAAAAGGFTAITAMPNTDPPIDDPKLVADVLARGEEIGLTQVAVAGTVTRGRAGDELAPLEDLYAAGARLFTDDGDAVAGRLLAEALARLAGLPGSVLAQHAEDPDSSDESTGPVAAAEEEVVRGDLELLGRLGGRYHCQHVSARGTVELIERARQDGLQVTAEVTPHHLSFDDTNAPAGDANFKMYPPIRSRDDRMALITALSTGVLDVVATDHAPHTTEEKAVGMERAPRGVIGLETAAAAVWEVLGDPIRLFETLSIVPARITRLHEQGRPVQRGMTANLVVFDPSARWVPDRFASKSRNSPYLGRTMHGAVRATLYRGRVTYEGAS